MKAKVKEMVTVEQLANMIDHTNLKAFADDAAFEKLCDEAKKYNFKMVAINPAQTVRCKKKLEGSPVHVGAAIGFPLGQTTLECKIFETKDAIEKGADEIDYVINVAELKNKNYDYIKKEMEEIVKICREAGKTSKVIFENCYLTDDEKRKVAEIAKEVKPDFIKTSTGFGTGGATVEDVKLMKSVVGDEVKVKAAGGIRDLKTALAMIEAGAERLGTSAGVAIVEEYNNQKRRWFYMKDEVKVCLIGSGRAGMIHGHNFAGSVPGGKIIAVCDPVGDVAENAAKELGIDLFYKEYLNVMKNEDIDAVIIACPTKFHKEITVAAANAGKHIFCEKPMAMNEEECDEMIEAAEKNHVKLQIGFMRRFDESFQEAKKMIEIGEIGEVVSVKSHTRGPSKPKEWMYDISISNGPLGEVCSHDIDTVRWFSGSEISSLYAIGGNYRNKEIAEKYPDFYDNVIMSVEFENGMQGVVEGAQYVQYGYDARVEILGTEGVICLGDVHEKKVLTCTKNHNVKRPTMHSWTYLFKDAYVAEDTAFVRAILDNTEVKATGHDGKMAVRIVRIGNESLKEKKIKKL